MGKLYEIEPSEHEVKSVADADMLLIAGGGSVKALGNGKVGGYLVMFGGPDQTDLYGEHFTKETDFGKHKSMPVYYDHGFDPSVKLAEIGEAEITKVDDIGVWIEAQLNIRDEYEKAIYQLVERGVLGWSSGTAGHLIIRDMTQEGDHLSVFIKKWALGLDASLTPTPAEPRIQAVTIKSKRENYSGDPVRLLENAKAAENAATRSGDEAGTTDNKSLSNSNAKGKANMKKKIVINGVEIEVDEKDEAKFLAGIQAEDPEPEGDPEGTDDAIIALKSGQDKLTDALNKLTEVVNKSMVPAGAAIKGAPVVIDAANRGDPDPEKAFRHYVRTGEKLPGLKRGFGVGRDGEVKAAMQENTAGEGGYLVPDDFYSGIIAKRDEKSIIRQAIEYAGGTVFKTSRDVLNVPTESTSLTKFAITAEEGAVSEEEPMIGQAAITIYKFTKLVKVSVELMEDEDANLNAFLENAFARAVAACENYYTMIGSGSSAPQGVFVGGTAGLTLDSATTIGAAEIPELYGKIGEAYEDGSVWAMKKATRDFIQSKTGDAFQFHQNPAGEKLPGKASIWSVPVVCSDNIAAIGTGLKSFLIGNFAFYGMAERRGMTVQRLNELYAGNGQVGILASIRWGGAVLQAEAFQYATHA